jgi:DnaJ homolog subfamily C member 3
MNTLKQCLHYDPDSKTCLKLHRLVKGLDKNFKSLDTLLEKEDWKGIVRLLLTPGQGKNGDLYQKYNDAMKTNLGKPEEVLPLVPTALLHPATPTASSASHKKRQKGFATVTFPDLDKTSPLRQTLVRSLCKSFIHLGDIAKSSEVCGLSES